jgi:hypothetical protein
MNLREWVSKLSVLGLLLCVLPVSGRALASDDYPVTEEEKAFVTAIRKAVDSHDVPWMAANVNFPIKAGIDGRRMTIKNKGQFARLYDKIIDAHVKSVVDAQNIDELWKNWRGIMIGSGEIWVGAACEQRGCQGKVAYFISAINNCWDGTKDLCGGNARPSP